MIIRCVALAALLLKLASAPLFAQDISVSKHTESPPSELDPAIRQVLSDGGQRVQVDGTAIDFWWVKVLALNAPPTPPGLSPQVGWGQVAEGSLVGAVKLSATYRDIRGRAAKAGVYTLRFGRQPADGDHLGVSPFREFLLLSPAAVDRTPKAVGHDRVVELSRQTTGISHPAVWSVDPPIAAGEPLTVQINAQGHKSVIFDVPAAEQGQAPGVLRFGLILVGKIEA